MGLATASALQASLATRALRIRASRWGAYRVSRVLNWIPRLRSVQASVREGACYGNVGRIHSASSQPVKCDVGATVWSRGYRRWPQEPGRCNIGLREDGYCIARCGTGNTLDVLPGRRKMYR